MILWKFVILETKDVTEMQETAVIMQFLYPTCLVPITVNCVLLKLQTRDL